MTASFMHPERRYRCTLLHPKRDIHPFLISAVAMRRALAAQSITDITEIAMDIEEQRMIPMSRPLIATLLASARSMDDREKVNVAEFALNQEGLSGLLTRAKWNLMMEGFSSQQIENRLDRPNEGYVHSPVEFGEIGKHYPRFQRIVIAGTPADPLDDDHPAKRPRTSKKDRKLANQQKRAKKLEIEDRLHFRDVSAQQGLSMIDAFEREYGRANTEAAAAYVLRQWDNPPVLRSSENGTPIRHIYMIGLTDQDDRFAIAAFPSDAKPFSRKAIVERVDEIEMEDALLRAMREMLLRYRDEVLVFWYNSNFLKVLATGSIEDRAVIRNPDSSWQTRRDVTGLRAVHPGPIYDQVIGKATAPFHKMPSIERKMHEHEEALRLRDRVAYKPILKRWLALRY